jgi:hypothetical protein
MTRVKAYKFYILPIYKDKLRDVHRVPRGGGGGDDRRKGMTKKRTRKVSSRLMAHPNIRFPIPIPISRVLIYVINYVYDHQFSS